MSDDVPEVPGPVLIGDIGGTNARFALAGEDNDGMVRFPDEPGANYPTIDDAIASALDQIAATLDGRLAGVRRSAGRIGQELMDRDLEVHRLEARRAFLQRFGLDACIGRMDPVDGSPVHVGRFGIADADGNRLLVDWRSPAAEPFFAATPSHPMGLAGRRRYRWTGGRITDWSGNTLHPDNAGEALAVGDPARLAEAVALLRR